MNPPIYEALWLKALVTDDSTALVAAGVEFRDDVSVNTDASEAASLGWWPERVEERAA